MDKLKQSRAVQIAHHAETEVPDFPRIEKVVKFLSGIPPGKLLDIGYCKGSFADYLVELGWECVGIDICPRSSGKVQTICCDIHHGIPLASESFDFLTAGEVIEHMIDEEIFIRECRRLLKKGGWLVITTPNLSYSLNRLLVLLGRTPRFVREPYHYHFHTLKTLRTLIEENGFGIRKVASSHVLYSRRRHFSGKIFEILADVFPSFGAHLIVFAQKL